MALLYIMCVFIMQLYAAFSPSHCFHYTRYILRKQCRPRSKHHYAAFDLHVGMYIFCGYSIQRASYMYIPYFDQEYETLLHEE